MRVGLISDTHGLVRPEALFALEGADLILHAGDVGKKAVLEQLRKVAPVEAVRGNVDRTQPLAALPERRQLQLAGWRVLLVHDRRQVAPEEALGVDVVVYGHSHKPLVTPGTPLWANPGSAGPRRFSLPVSVGWLELSGSVPRALLQPLCLSGVDTKRVKPGSA